MASFTTSINVPGSAETKWTLVFPAVFLVAGLAFVGFAAKEALLSKKLHDVGTKTFGEVTSVEEYTSHGKNGKTKRNYRSKFKFTAEDGSNHEVVISGKYPVGSSRELLYLPDSPDIVHLTDFFSMWGTSLGFGAGGLFCLAIGCFTGVSIWRRQKEIEWLRRHGTRALATVVGINTKTNRRSKGRSYQSYQVVCRWRDSMGAEHTLTSEATRTRPSDALLGQEIEVLVDPYNPTKHYFSV